MGLGGKQALRMREGAWGEGVGPRGRINFLVRKDKWKEESEVGRGTEKSREAAKEPHPQQGEVKQS